jgi:hypothetical protein
MDLLKATKSIYAVSKDTLIEVESYKIGLQEPQVPLMKDTISIEILNWCLRWKSSLS